jgi:alpha-tubulin suppressor-like RCC1 family protein
MKNFTFKCLRRAVLVMFLNTLCFSSGAQVIVWGNNGNKQLFVPPSATNVIALAAGDRHCLALRADGMVVAWGANFTGEASVPSDLTNAVGIAAGSTHSVALRSDGSVAQWGHINGTSFSSPTTVPLEATNIASSGMFRQFFIERDKGPIHPDGRRCRT